MNGNRRPPENLLVIKVGGGEGIDWDAVADDLALVVASRPVVLVHGGSHTANQLAEALGRPPRFITSPSGFESRWTDRPAMEVFQMAYCGLVNKTVVEKLARRGLRPVGLSGMDGGIWQGARKDAIRAVENGRTRIIRDSLTGRVDRVGTGLLMDLLQQGYLPVLTPPALSDDGLPINVDGDRAAAMTALACGATELLILSNVPGLLARFPDPDSLVPEIARSGLDEARETLAAGRMKIKLLAAAEGLDGGLQRVVIGSARVPGPIRAALAGKATVIVGDAPPARTSMESEPGEPHTAQEDWGPAEELLWKMVRIPSLSGQERPLAEFLVAHMQAVGFAARVDEVGNAIGIRELPDARGEIHHELMLLGHMDVVPGAIPVRVEQGRIYGRGTVDAKGPLAVFLSAAAKATLLPGTRIVVAGAVEEESTASRGARHLAAQRRPQACIIGEPSGWDSATLGYKGRVVLDYEARQPSGHSAGPHPAVAEAGCQWWQRLQDYCRSFNEGRSSLFQQLLPSLRTFQTDSDGLMDRARLTVSIRLPPDFDASLLEHHAREGLAESEAVRSSGAEPAVLATRTNLLARSFQRVFSRRGIPLQFKTKTGTSDMNVVEPVWKTPILAYGPGDSRLDHTPDEHLELDEYRRSIGLLQEVIEQALTLMCESQ